MCSRDNILVKTALVYSVIRIAFKLIRLMGFRRYMIVRFQLLGIEVQMWITTRRFIELLLFFSLSNALGTIKPRDLFSDYDLPGPI